MAGISIGPTLFTVTEGMWTKLNTQSAGQIILLKLLCHFKSLLLLFLLTFFTDKMGFNSFFGAIKLGKQSSALRLGEWTYEWEISK